MNKTSMLIVAIVGLAIAAYFFGTKNQKNADQAKKSEAVEQSIERHDKAVDAGQKASQSAAVRRTQTEAVFNGLHLKEIVYAQKNPDLLCGLDADGLRLWMDANAGADFESSSVGNGTVPAALAATKWPVERPADESHRNGEALSPMPGQASGINRLVGGDN